MDGITDLQMSQLSHSHSRSYWLTIFLHVTCLVPIVNQMKMSHQECWMHSDVTGEEIAGIFAIESEASTSIIDFSTLQLHHRKSRVAKATLVYIAGFIGRSLLNK
jgi:hypothetical protein